MASRVGLAVWIAAITLLFTGPAAAELPAERVGQVLRLPEAPGPHWVWIGDLVLRRTALFDAGSGSFLGMLNAGYGIVAPSFSRARGEIYLPETHYSRHHRGARSDVVTVYDAASLDVVGEIEIPPKRADSVAGVNHSALLDDGRFLVIYNMTPATSVSVVDVESRRFVGEIATPGCALVFPAGPRRFFMLCGDGSLLTLRLDASGAELGKERSAPFFDPQHDPITEKAVRHAERWIFVSFDAVVHPVDVSGASVRPEPTWSLLNEKDREERWRIGGWQHLAVHEQSGRLFSLVHQGGPDGHKDPGSEVWVHDLAEQRRVARFPVRNLAAAFLGQLMEVDGGVTDWLLQRVVPNPGAESVLVTQGDDPRLLLASREAGTVAVYDAVSGEFLRDLRRVGLATGLMHAP